MDGFAPIDSCVLDTQCGFITIYDTSAHNLWQQGVPTKSVFKAAYLGSRAIVTDTTSTYPVNSHSYFDVDLSAALPNPILSFWHRFDTEKNKDGGYLEYSTNGKKTWHKISPFDSSEHAVDLFNYGVENLYGEGDTLFNGFWGFSGDSESWVKTRVQWIWHVGVKRQPDTFHVRFHFISDSIEENKDGWIIDNITSLYTKSFSIDENVGKPSLNIYPNPTSGNFTIELDNPQGDALSVQIVNTKGQVVKEWYGLTKNELFFNQEEIPAGFYFVNTWNAENGAQKVGKFIAQ